MVTQELINQLSTWNMNKRRNKSFVRLRQQANQRLQDIKDELKTHEDDSNVRDM